MKKTCPHSTQKLVNVALKLGEKLSNIKLYPYQIPFSKRIIESVLKEDVSTITGLFSRQCLDPNQLCLTPDGPQYVKDLQAVEHLDILSTKTTEVLEKTRPFTRPSYELTIHNGTTIRAGEYHLFKNSFNNWEHISRFEGEIQCSLRFLKKGNDAIGFYASQVLLNKRQAASVDKDLGTDILTVHITHRMEKILPEKLKFVQDFSYLTARVDVDADKSRVLIKKAFENSYETIKWMMGLSKLDMFRNNRKYAPRITLPYRSNGYYFDSLLFFLQKYGFSATLDKKSNLVFTNYEDISRLFEFFRYDPHYVDVREFVNLYKHRVGFRLSPNTTVKLIRKYPDIKAHVKSSLLSHYRKNGILLATALHLLRKSGVHETEVDLPNLVFAPVRSVKQVHTMEMIDIETQSETFDAGIFYTHNCGKTEAVAVVCGALMAFLPHMCALFPDDKRFKKFINGIWIGIFAPSKDQSKTTFDRIRGRLSNNQGVAILREFGLDISTSRGDTVQLTNSSMCRCMTASDTSQIESKTYHLVIIEEGQDVSPRKIRKCLTGDTEIYTNKGPMAIKNYVDLRCEAPVANKEGEFVNPTDWHNNGKQPVYRVTAANGYSIKCTLNHQLYVRTRTAKKPEYMMLSSIMDAEEVQLAVIDVLPYTSSLFDHGRFLGLMSSKRYPENLRFCMITNIEYLGVEDTYCIEVPGRNFIANGIISSNSIRPMCAAVAGTIVMVGTANEKISDLHSNIKYNRAAYNRTGTQNHFQVNWQEAAQSNPRYELYVKSEMDKLGADSDEFRMSYLNEFILQRGMAFSEHHLSNRTKENPFGMFIPNMGLCPLYRGSNTVVVGIDVGKARDSSVLTALEIDESKEIILPHTITHPKILLNWLELIGDNFNVQFKEMIQFIQNVKADMVVIDTGGKGDVVYDFLEAVFPALDFIPFTSTSKSKDKLCRLALHEINSGRILIPANAAARNIREFRNFLFQCEILIKDYNAQGYLRCHKPTEKIDGQYPHDDFPDSLFLALWGAREDLIYEAEIIENPFYERGPNEFLRRLI